MTDNIQARAPATAETPITIDEAYYERLHGLALKMAEQQEAAQLLLDELERAEVVASGEMPDNVVTIGSQVTYCDEELGRIHSVRVVFPADADISQGRVSVLTPIGAALIGLAEGQRITWESRQGTRTLVVQQVVPASPDP